MKTFLKMVLVTFLWFNTATAESDLPPCQGEDYMYWSNCFGSYTNRDVTINILKNFPRMNELYPNSSYNENYKGEFGSKPGVKNGKGKKELYLNDEIYSTYDGNYFNDQREGYGVYTNIKRNWDYKGNWKNDLRHGQGTYVSSKGNKYVGEWKDGKFEGQGSYIYSNGQKFFGEYKDGKMNGQGTYTWPKGNKYVGEWKDGKMNGQGTYTWANGRKFVGKWKDGKRNGQGTFTLPSGNKFVGEYKDGKRNGQGTYTWFNVNNEVAIYKDDKIVKIISTNIKNFLGNCNIGNEGEHLLTALKIIDDFNFKTNMNKYNLTYCNLSKDPITFRKILTFTKIPYNKKFIGNGQYISLGMAGNTKCINFMIVDMKVSQSRENQTLMVDLNNRTGQYGIASNDFRDKYCN